MTRDEIGMWDEIGGLYAAASAPDREPRWAVFPVGGGSDTFTVARIPKEKP